jgi:hypothetical protein
MGHRHSRLRIAGAYARADSVHAMHDASGLRRGRDLRRLQRAPRAPLRQHPIRLLPPRALSAHQGAKRQKTRKASFAVRNQHASTARRPHGRRAFRRRSASSEARRRRTKTQSAVRTPTWWKLKNPARRCRRETPKTLTCRCRDADEADGPLRTAQHFPYPPRHPQRPPDEIELAWDALSNTYAAL